VHNIETICKTMCIVICKCNHSPVTAQAKTEANMIFFIAPCWCIALVLVVFK